MKNYNFNISVPNTTWTVTHNLNSTNVILDVFVMEGGSLEKILPANVVITNANTVTVTFSVARTGVVRVIAGS